MFETRRSLGARLGASARIVDSVPPTGGIGL